jgi:hypothetical protein
MLQRRVSSMSIHVFGLEKWEPEQLNLFALQPLETQIRCRNRSTIPYTVRSADAKKRVNDAVDALNNRYGEFVITPALMLDMQGTILDRIAFGQIRDI